MNNEELKELRRDITAIIDDVKYQSDSLTDLERLPVIQLKVLLAKMNKLTEKTVILVHYIEKEGKLSDLKESANEPSTPSEPENLEESVEELVEPEVESSETSISEEINSEANDQEESPKENIIASQNVEEKLKNLVVTDLNAAIGINEKYLFASELFGGNIENLSETLLKIDSMKDYSEAFALLQSLEAKFNWDKESGTVQSFVDLVERKFNQS